MNEDTFNTNRQIVLKNRRAYRNYKKRLKCTSLDLAFKFLSFNKLLDSKITNFGINNLTSDEFDKDVLEFLGLGLKFIPTPNISSLELQTDLMEYLRKIKLNEFFKNKPNNREYTVQMHKFKTPSTFDIADNKSGKKNYIQSVKSNIKYLFDQEHQIKRPYLDLKKEKKFKRNYNQDTWIKVQNVLKNDKYIIKPADKNLGLTIMYKTWYIDECMRQLTDTSTYREISYDSYLASYDDIQSEGLTLFAEFKQIHPHLLKCLNYNLKNTDSVILPEFYIIPKIHKEPLKGRPIVPSHSWITSIASKIVDYYLQPIINCNKEILTNSTSLILDLEKINTNKELIFITGDVTSLYTNIPTDKGIEVLGTIINTFYSNNLNLAGEIRTLLRWVLKNNYFKFNNKYFHQINGTAMGTSCAPTYANLFMSFIESKLGMNKGIIYRRYIDDILCIFEKDCLTESVLFKYYFNTIDENIQINWETSNESVAFLDLNIYKYLCYIRVETYSKSINKYLYIPFNSYHPFAQKLAFIKTELIRFLRTNSTQESFVKNKRLFYLRLKERGYNSLFLINQFEQVKFKDRSKYLKVKSLNLEIYDKARNNEINWNSAITTNHKKFEGNSVSFITRNNPFLSTLNINNLLLFNDLDVKPRIVRRSAKNLLNYVNIFNKDKIKDVIDLTEE